LITAVGTDVLFGGLDAFYGAWKSFMATKEEISIAFFYFKYFSPKNLD
jgi:hypothetical protein